jgi:hypothetical protein
MRSLTIIVSDDDDAKLQVVRRVHPFVSGHRVAQLALRRGLRELAEDPTQLVVEASIAAMRTEPEGGVR